jgi:hypothetical protein
MMLNMGISHQECIDVRRLQLLFIAVSIFAVSACGPDPNSPYRDPGTPDRRAPHSGLALELPDGMQPSSPDLAGLPGHEIEGGVTPYFSTGDEASIVSVMPRRPGERFIRGMGRTERRSILI